MHGGKSIPAPLTAGGRHSKYMPLRLQGRLEEALKDEALLSLNAEIGVIDTRLSELFARLDTEESSAAWVLANKLYHEMQCGDPAKGIAARHSLGIVLEKGLADVAAWSEIVGLVEARRKCAESENKRLALMDQFITAKQANLLVAGIVRLVTENVTDPDARTRIAQGLVGLVNAGGSSGDSGTAFN